MICPNCGGTVPNDTTVCPDCQEDLAGLARLEYGHAIHYNEALALAREGQFDEAKARLLLALELKPSFVPAHMLLAKVCARQERWAEASTSAARALELEPDDPAVLQLADEIARVNQEAEAEQREGQKAALGARRAKAERHFVAYQRDLIGAFGLGVGIAAFLGLILSWIGGKKES